MKAKRKYSDKREQLIFYCIMIAIPVIQICIFYFGVNFNSFVLAFKSYTADGVKYGFDNFKQVFFDLFNDIRWAYAFKNSLLVYAIATGVNIPLALLFAYYIYRKKPAANFFKTMLYFPAIASSIVMVILFKYFVDTFIPSVVFQTSGKEIMGLMSNPDTTMLMLIFYMIITGFGTNTLLLSGAMASVNDSTVEAAKIDGATPFQIFFKVVLPHVWPTLVTILVTGLATLFLNQFNLFSLYGNNAETKFITIGYLLYKLTYRASNTEYPYLAAFGLILTVIIIPITLGIRKLLNKVGPSDE